MKKLMIGAAALLFTTGAFAQNTMSGSSARFGLKAGVNLSRLYYSGTNSGIINNNTKDNVGFNVTGYGDFGVANNFFIQPGISLQNKGTKIEGTFDLGENSVTGTNTTNVMAIEVPINAVYRIPTGDAGAVLISAGPYVGFNISGKSKVDVTSGDNQGSSNTDLKFGNSKDDNLSSTDFGANFGLGYRLNSGLGFGANYGLGLTNLVPKDNRTDNGKLTNRVLGFYLSYSL
ncbi:hypothetical protein ABIB40_002251 [Pedobacter sp. UYP30]|uniref:porin family protein n=1 Tax=Pedobacter sp. UYP30 TaxID=1756400 RepID=UPI00339B4044